MTKKNIETGSNVGECGSGARHWHTPLSGLVSPPNRVPSEREGIQPATITVNRCKHPSAGTPCGFGDRHRRFLTERGMSGGTG